MARRILREVLPVAAIVQADRGGSSRLRAWARARAKLVKQIAALEEQAPIHGHAWVEGQKRYWVVRLAEMDAFKPK